MTDDESLLRPRVVDLEGTVHQLMFDTTSNSPDVSRKNGTLFCGASFRWSYQVPPNQVDWGFLVVTHADGAPVTCLGCLANELG